MKDYKLVLFLMCNVSPGKPASNFTGCFKEQGEDRQRGHSQVPKVLRRAFGNDRTCKLRLPHQPPITRHGMWGEGGVYSFANSLRHPINTAHTHRGITPFLPYPFLRPPAARVPSTLSGAGEPLSLHVVIDALITPPSVAIMPLLILLLIF